MAHNRNQNLIHSLTEFYPQLKAKESPNIPPNKQVTVQLTWSFDSNCIPLDGSLCSEPFGTESTSFQGVAMRIGKASFSFLLRLLGNTEERTLPFTGQFNCKYRGVTGVETREFNGIFSSVIMSVPVQATTFYPIESAFDTEWAITFEEPVSIPLDHKAAYLKDVSKLAFKGPFPVSTTDISLITTQDGRRFQVHKQLLTARSPVFAAMFGNEQFNENQRKLVEIEDISGQVMEGLLMYIYKCHVPEIETMADHLLVAADKYDFPLLVEECAQSIVSNLNVANAAYFYHFAHFQQHEVLKRKIAHFIDVNREAVQQSEGFREFLKHDSTLVSQLFRQIV